MGETNDFDVLDDLLSDVRLVVRVVGEWQTRNQEGDTVTVTHRMEGEAEYLDVEVMQPDTIVRIALRLLL